MTLLSFVYEKLVLSSCATQRHLQRCTCATVKARIGVCNYVSRKFTESILLLSTRSSGSVSGTKRRNQPLTCVRREHSPRSALFTIHKVGHCSLDCSLSSAAYCVHGKADVCPFVSFEQTRLTDEETTKELSEFKGAVQQHPVLLCLLAQEQQCGATEVT